MAKKKEKTKVQSSINFKDRVGTKMIAVMMCVTIIPLVIALGVSYQTSTTKAMADAEESLNWQAWYIESEFETVVSKNIQAIQAVADSPSTTDFMEKMDNPIYKEKELRYISAIDAHINDGNITVLTGADGMQVLRTSGDCVDVSTRDYFTEAIKGTTYISNILVSKSTGLRQMTMAVPIEGTDGSIIGIVQRNYDLNEFHKFLAEEADTAFIVDREGKVAAHSKHEIAADEEEDMSAERFMSSGENQGVYITKLSDGEDSVVAYAKSPLTNWTICTAEHEDSIMSSARASALVVVVIGLIMMAIAAAISIFMARAFVEPIKYVSESLAALADGRFKSIDKFTGRKDEFGEMVGNTNSVIGRLSEIVTNIKMSASSVGASSEELSDMANQISQTAEDVSNAVQEIASGATQQADEIQSASENVGRIGDAVSDVQDSTGSLSNIAGKMKEASEVSSNSLESLQSSATEMTEKIDEISRTIQATQEAVSNINDKVAGITSIATQTNLLSLNASIEAARAGEAGKGFAVVAEEIGQLADNSKNMADEIRKEMDVLLEQATAAVEAAEDVKQGNMDQQVALGDTLNAVNGMLEDIGNTVGGVKLISTGAETCETSKNAVVDTMSALSAISEENAASSQETGASMQELSATVTTLASSADALKSVAETLNEEMAFFK